MRSAFLFVLLAVLAFSAAGQTRRGKPAPKKAATTAPVVPTTTVIEIPEPVVKTQPKKNERPAADGKGTDNVAEIKAEPSYFYEFTHPEFPISKIVIQHDDTGLGTVTFTKRLFSETVSDPLQVSPAALERINAAYSALNFLDSNDRYQYEKDYPHLGTMTFRLRRQGKDRTTSFNFSTVKGAKALGDEYRRLSNQYVWIFDITVARENQPLDAPRLLESLDSLMRRNEISDPVQMLPLLKELSNDERIPLIARNRASKLVERIENKK